MNPFQNSEQSKMLPNNVFEQIQNMDYFTHNSIKQVTFASNARSSKRNSTFAKNINLMRQAANKQSQKYIQLLDS